MHRKVDIGQHTGRRIDPRIVDQHINPAKTGHRLGAGTDGAIGGGNIDRHGHGTAAGRPDRRGGGFRLPAITIHHHNRRTSLGQRFGDGPAQPQSGPCNKGDFACETQPIKGVTR